MSEYAVTLPFYGHPGKGGSVSRTAEGGAGKGEGDRDLCAAVGLVGRGEVYEKWKRSGKYEEWRKQTDALMVALAP